MHFGRSTLLATASLASLATAQRPANESICDYYTTALLKENTAANQQKLVTLIVNTVALGNYTQPNVGIAVPGLLAPGAAFNGTPVNLAPYFNGELASTNTGKGYGESVNFLDGGGAEALKQNKPAFDEKSNQYFFVTHLVQYFGVLLGCSKQGTADFPSYSGTKSQYEAHKYMHLNPYEMGYFIQQVGLAAASFGVTTEDVTAVGTALDKLFSYRCAPPTVVVPEQGPALQAICLAPSCPLAENNTCSAYEPSVMPMNATNIGNASANGGQGRMNGPKNGGGANTTPSSGSPTTAGAGSSPTGAASGGTKEMLGLTVVLGAMVVGAMML